MKCLTALLLVLALAACNQKAEYRTDGTGPSSGSGKAAEIPAATMGTTEFVTTQDALVCKRQTDVYLSLRIGTAEATRSDPATFEDRKRKGKIISIASGTRLECDDQRIEVKLVNGQQYWMRRGTILDGDEAGERGLVREDHLRRVN